jgi:curved DNA-binding protein CbpA
MAESIDFKKGTQLVLAPNRERVPPLPPLTSLTPPHPTADYYAILGCPQTATVDELKSAHIKLALKFHPDMAATATATTTGVPSSSGAGGAEVLTLTDRAERFREVSEAWSVLSKSETRSRYDTFRQQQGGITTFRADGSTAGVPSEIPLNYDTQRANFAAVRHAASSNWQEIKDKYKTEKWQNMPLSERKSLRRRPAGSLLGNIFFLAVPTVIVGYSAYSYWSSHFGSEASKTRKKLPSAVAATAK